jgi:hypothetical protein
MAKDEIRRMALCLLADYDARTPGELFSRPVVSSLEFQPFLDGTVVGQFGRWGDAGTQRTLVSTLPELAKLANQTGKPLAGFRDLLFLDAPVPDELFADGRRVDGPVGLGRQLVRVRLPRPGVLQQVSRRPRPTARRSCSRSPATARPSHPRRRTAASARRRRPASTAIDSRGPEG